MRAKDFIKVPSRFRYLFDLGDTRDGAVGATIQVIARTPQEALARVRDAGQTRLPETFEIPGAAGSKAIEYGLIHLQTQNITLNDMVEAEPYEDET